MTHHYKPGMTLRAYRLDGSSVVGVAEKTPRRDDKGVSRGTVTLREHAEEFEQQFVEPAGATLDRWWLDTEARYLPKVSWETIAYGVLDDMLAPASSTLHMGEYVRVHWAKHEITSGLGRMGGSVKLEDGRIGEYRDIAAEDFIERLAPALWAYQDVETVRVAAAISDARARLAGEARYICLPRWAIPFVDKTSGLRQVAAPYPMLMTGFEQGRFTPLLGIVPTPKEE